MKTQLLRDLQTSIDMRSDNIAEEQKRYVALGPSNRTPLDTQRLYRMEADQRLARRLMKRLLELENIVTYMETHSANGQ